MAFIQYRHCCLTPCYYYFICCDCLLVMSNCCCFAHKTNLIFFLNQLYFDKSILILIDRQYAKCDFYNQFTYHIYHTSPRRLIQSMCESRLEYSPFTDYQEYNTKLIALSTHIQHFKQTNRYTHYEHTIQYVF